MVVLEVTVVAVLHSLILVIINFYQVLETKLVDRDIFVAVAAVDLMVEILNGVHLAILERVVPVVEETLITLMVMVVMLITGPVVVAAVPVVALIPGLVAKVAKEWYLFAILINYNLIFCYGKRELEGFGGVSSIS